MDIQLAPQQNEAFQEISQWFNHSDEQVFVLHGYAGTGKTTIANHIAKTLAPNRTVFMAYTGKAVNVLRRKGCTPCSTIHKAIYNCLAGDDKVLTDLTKELLDETDDAKIRKIRRELSERKTLVGGMKITFNPIEDVRKASLLIIDECSMLGTEIFDDLRKCDVKMLLLGDPAQLPPVKAKSINLHANFLLTEIHRQARESPILMASMNVRMGRRLKLGIHEGAAGKLIVTNREIAQKHYMSADQIIVRKNDTRHRINRQMREWRGFSHWLHEDEKIVITKNNYEIGINNGQIIRVANIKDGADPYSCLADFNTEEGKVLRLKELWKGGFLGTSDVQTPDDAAVGDYGYALTCHKAQGSEWDKIIIFNEGGYDNRSWLYTALTRARTTALVVTNDYEE